MAIRRRISVFFILCLSSAGALFAECRPLSGEFVLGRNDSGALIGTGSATIAGERAPLAGTLKIGSLTANQDGSLSADAWHAFSTGSRPALTGGGRLLLRRTGDGSEYRLRVTAGLSDGARRGEAVLEGSADLSLSTGTMTVRGSVCE